MTCQVSSKMCLSLAEAHAALQFSHVRMISNRSLPGWWTDTQVPQQKHDWHPWRRPGAEHADCRLTTAQAHRYRGWGDYCCLALSIGQGLCTPGGVCTASTLEHNCLTTHHSHSWAVVGVHSTGYTCEGLCFAAAMGWLLTAKAAIIQHAPRQVTRQPYLPDSTL